MMHEITISIDDEEGTIELEGELKGISILDLACALTQLIRVLDRKSNGKLIDRMAEAAEAMKSEGANE